MSRVVDLTTNNASRLKFRTIMDEYIRRENLNNLEFYINTYKQICGLMLYNYPEIKNEYDDNLLKTWNDMVDRVFIK